MRIRNIHILNVIICIIICLATRAFTGYNNVGPYGQLGISESYTAQTQGFLHCSFSFNGSFAFDKTMVPMVIRQAGSPKQETPPYAILYDLNPSMSMGITNLIDLSISQPVYFDVMGGGLPSGGAGDLKTAIKFRTSGFSNDAKLMTALMVDAAIPLFESKQGYFLRHTYFLPNNKNAVLDKPAGVFTSGKPSFTTIIIGSINLNNVRTHINIGCWWPLHAELDPAITAAAGIELFKDDWVSFYTDIGLEPRLINILDSVAIADDPLHITPGLSIKAPGGALFSCGCSFSLSSGKVYSYINKSDNMLLNVQAEPNWNAFVQLGWSGTVSKRDRDADGIIAKEDKCPDISEDFDGFLDYDGCPDIDNDNDKIPDERDSCRNIPEDLDGFQDLDGCPDLDNDMDGVSDSTDNCPEQSEDKDGFEDLDGCPESDNDHDEIPDSVDKCILEAEDRDYFEDIDGCPDVDNDNDGVYDTDDKCPDSVGVTSNQGCPDVRPKGKEITFGRLILPGVHFEMGTATLTVGSFPELDRLLYSLLDWPEVSIEIHAHTDNSMSVAKSKILSQKQAYAVSNYLIEKGIPTSRLIVVGRGSGSPIADNRTVQGKSLNNRIEIHRIDK